MSVDDTFVVHKFGDTYSVRLGGQYNIEAPFGVVSLRAGGYYDSSATSPAYTRLEFNTLEKYAATVGLGLHVGGLRFKQKGQPLDGNGKLLPAINNAHMRIVSFGMQVVFDEVIGSKR